LPYRFHQLLFTFGQAICEIQKVNKGNRVIVVEGRKINI